ncbi:hypothetical protein EHQ12_00265 [Leptospira gomenensis]|uniref:Uncharacterized protein n=1 Tax=Leptospira gomenensis TaxID=2484974 RepID=A0A5F1YZG1_9LEPT|nr:hypothetical protein [Leptospira gomenensis]TGK27902.1 hypothetical protein EHQ17_17545 [Leptospira gomenensis]TGK45492.1 hypothetical protein EHQ12_00265 [Leptospira gomenensis]TGK45879.1 hypothetical protein EHQ07_09430 [Leptospira gomenensis]TGK65195.1 hypothetical protein EHQ13_05495 [Leptospira gomenensis]
MRFLNSIKNSKLLILGLYLPQFVILGIYFRDLYLKYFEFCPNREFLTWDPDARLTTSIQIAASIRSFDLFEFLRLILDSPTWPVLRNLPEAILIFRFGPGGVPVSLFTFVESILVIAVVPWILFRFMRNGDGVKNAFPIFTIAAFLFPIVWGGLLLNPGWMHYSFSGMLEIQGGLFFLFVLIAFWDLLDRENLNPEKDGSQSPWFLFTSVNLLFHTKYPYGYIFLFFGVLFLCVFRFRETGELLRKFFLSFGLGIGSERKRRFRLIPIGASFLLIAISVLLSDNILIGKTKAYLRYAAVLSFWIVSTISLWRIFYPKRSEKSSVIVTDVSDKMNGLSASFEEEYGAASAGLSVWKIFWTFCILPIGTWVLLHPDRFSSSGSTIRHAQGAGLLPGQGDDSLFSLTYVREIAENSLYSPFGGWILLSVFVLGIFIGFLRYRKEKTPTASLFVFLSVAVSILGLTLMTPNHQPRHIYHLYPALFLGVCLFFRENFAGVSGTFRSISVFYYILIILFTAGYFIRNKASVWDRTNLCFSGTDQSLFYSAYDVEEVLSKNLNRDSVLWNLLPLEHPNRPDVTLSFFRAGWFAEKKVREKKKREQFDPQKRNSFAAASYSNPDWFLIGSSCEETIRRAGFSKESFSEFARSPNTKLRSFPIRGACVLHWKNGSEF